MGGQDPQLPKSHCVKLSAPSARSAAFLEEVGHAFQRLPVGTVCTPIPHQGTTVSQGEVQSTESWLCEHRHSPGSYREAFAERRWQTRKAGVGDGPSKMGSQESAARHT